MKIVVCAVNSPRFLAIQHETLKRHFKAGPYEMIVFNDAKSWPDYSNGNDATMPQQIRDTCKKLGIQCIDVPNDHHKDLSNAGQRCADAYNFVLDYQKKHPDNYLGLDSDMFLVSDFYGFHGNYQAAVVFQVRGPTRYFWNGLYWFNFPKMRELKLLDWNPLAGTDVGGSMTKWLRKCGSKIFPIEHLASGNWYSQDFDTLGLSHYPELKSFLNSDPRNIDNKYYFCELYHKKFLHYRGGGNWALEGSTLEGSKEAFDVQKSREVLMCKVLQVAYEENGNAETQ
jgi:hypothetical protein